MFIIGTDTFLISPLLTTLSSLYHIDTSISGWMVSAYTIGYALFALVSGPISDGRDRKKVMVYSCLAFTISTFLCGFANSFALMFLFRFLAGISASFVTSQVWASIPVVVEKKEYCSGNGICNGWFICFSDGRCSDWWLPCWNFMAFPILYHFSGFLGFIASY